MKTRAFFLFLLFGTILALAILAIPMKSALAKTCYDKQHPNGYPCPQPQKKPTATDVPPTLTATSAPQPTDTPAVTNTNTPDAGQLALMCTSMGFIPNTGNPNGNNLNSPPSNPVPDNGSNGFFDVFRNGGGLFGILIGLIVGVLIGLLLPAVQKGFTGGNIAPTDSHGFSNANGDQPTGPLIDTATGAGGGPHTAQPPGPPDNPAGIIAPTDSHGLSNVNGDTPPGPPGNTAIGAGGGPHTATPPGPPQSLGTNVNGDMPPGPPDDTVTGAGGGAPMGQGNGMDESPKETFSDKAPKKVPDDPEAPQESISLNF